MDTNKKLMSALSSMLREHNEWDDEDEEVICEASAHRNKARQIYRKAKAVLKAARAEARKS